MSGPINYITFELAEIQHREYGAEASRYWGQNVTKSDQPARLQGRKLALALGGIGMTVVLLVQPLPL